MKAEEENESSNYPENAMSFISEGPTRGLFLGCSMKPQLGHFLKVRALLLQGFSSSMLLTKARCH